MGTDNALVTVATFSSSLDASLAKGALEAAGIRAFVPNEGVGSLSRQRGALIVEELRVFERDRDRALVALRRLNLHVVTDSERERVKDASPLREWRNTVKVLAVLLLAFLLLALIATARNRAGQQPLGSSRSHVVP